jgi:hypothetical protein
MAALPFVTGIDLPEVEILGRPSPSRQKEIVSCSSGFAPSAFAEPGLGQRREPPPAEAQESV